MAETSYYTQSELQALGLGGLGERVLLSRKTSIYGAARIFLGSDVRIDDFTVLGAGEGGIFIGDHVHISVSCSLLGRARIELGEFSGLSAKVSVFSSSDDYSGENLTNPTVPAEFTSVEHAEVRIGRHAIVGAGAVLLPGSCLEDGVALGALSLVRGRCDAFGVYFGAPARRIGSRKTTLLEKEKELVQWKSSNVGKRSMDQ